MHVDWRALLGGGALLGLGLLLAWAAVTARTLWTLTHPPRRTYGSAVARGRPGTPDELPPGPRGARAHKAWQLAARGLSIPVWEIEGDDPAAPTWVLAHGWGDSRVGALTRAPFVAPLASRIVLIDLPGHGEAPGRCSLGALEPLVLQELLAQLAPASCVLFGWSLGAGAAIAAGAEGPTNLLGVVAEAPYRLASTPARNMLRSKGLPASWNLTPALAWVGVRAGIGARWRGFDRAVLASRLRVPLLVLHGELDAISPVEDGRAIAGASPDGRLVVLAEGGHASLWTDPRHASVGEAALRAFAARVHAGRG